MSSQSDTIRHLARLVLTAGALAILFYWQRERLEDIPAAVAQTSWMALLASGVLNTVGSIVLPAWMTRLATVDSGRITLSLGRLIRLNLLLRFYSLVLPKGAVMALRWKWYQSPGRRADALALVVFERLVLFFVYILAAVVFLSIEYPRLGANGGVVLLGTFCVMVVWGACLSPFFLPALAQPSSRVVGVLESKLPRAVGSRLHKLREAIGAFHQIERRRVGTIWLVSVASYVLFVLSAYVLMRGMSLPVGLWAAAWMRPLVFVFTLLPLTVGGLGVREAGYTLFLSWYGVPGATALAFGLLLFSIQVAIGLVGVLLDLARQALAKH